MVRGPEAPGSTGASATLTASAVAAPRLAPAAVAPVEPAPPGALPAAIAERYEVGALLGRGGMGAVYRARDRRLGREVALKLLFDDAHGERLLREARAQARVDHDHVCKIYEVGVESGAGYIAMQYIAGERFDRAAPHMTLEQRLRVVAQVGLALHEAHRLGIVHRDVKPSNILVERGEDGAPRPYLTDFGIAREVGGEGRTASGVIAGTPAFMAPEQARGDVRALDRRTDVYGLGATAYCVLAGRPPFQGDEPWQLIQRIVRDDAPPIRRVAPEIPVDLEAILARCLERDPRRRYGSMRALADDLQRFLDGDPVEARRLSRGYVLLRKARRHRARLAIAAAALVAALIAVALWARDRRLGAERAERARDLAQDAKAMEVFLIRAYELPQHDVERERAVVRARLRDIEQRMAAAGPEGVGPANYALGRGYLALHEADRARRHLAAALAAGYASPDLDYAMGLALGELYDRALVLARRIDSPERQNVRIAALTAEYVVPASRHLQAALAAQLEAPAYVEGLIELRAGRPEAALARAKAALDQAPWLYEARRLEGDAHFAIGSRYRHDAAFDHDRMMVDYRAAAEAYRAAGEIARSDPEVHEAACRLWAQIMQTPAAHPALQAAYEQAMAACGRAIACSPGSASARIEQAFVEALYAWGRVASGSTSDSERDAEAVTEAVLDAAIADANRAAQQVSGDPMAPYVVGLAASARAYQLNALGRDSRAAVDRAVAAYEDALRIDPVFTWAVNDLASAYLDRATSERSRGLDPAASLARIVALGDRAVAIDPRALHARGNQATAHLFEADYRVDTGRDPGGALALARAALDDARALSPAWPAAGHLSAYACWIEARYAVAAGVDPADAIARGEAIARAELVRSPAAVEIHEVLGKLATTRALQQFERGRDPGPALDAAAAAFQHALARKPRELRLLVWRARVEALRLRWAARRGAVDPDRVTAAASPLVAVLATPHVDAGPAQVLAELHAIRAAVLAARGRSADADLAAGLARADEALAQNPGMVSALAAKAELLLARARGAADPQRRERAARAAAEAVAAAVHHNPLLGQRSGDGLGAASDLLCN